MNRIRRIAVVLAGLAAALVAFATPAFAKLVPEPLPGGARSAAIPGTEFRPSAPLPAAIRTVTHTVVTGGMPGWQIALIAIAAALLAATAAVLADRARAARRKAATASA